MLVREEGLGSSNGSTSSHPPSSSPRSGTLLSSASPHPSADLVGEGGATCSKLDIDAVLTGAALGASATAMFMSWIIHNYHDIVILVMITQQKWIGNLSWN
jgi:hypothetical protein